MRKALGVAICLTMFCVVLSAKAQEASPRFESPQVVSTVEPAYPVNSVAGGTVVLKVTISSSGEITDVRVLQEAKGFTHLAIEAVRKWKFQPAKLDGRPITASIPVSFSFSQPIVWWNPQAK
jgi:protein TonB